MDCSCLPFYRLVVFRVEAGDVGLADGMFFELLAQVKCCGFSLCIDHYTGSVHVQAVYGVHLELQGS